MGPNVHYPPLTLAELVTAVAASVPRLRRDLVERRLQHWALRGVLKPLGQVHVGSGRSRQFAAETAHIAAVLMRVGDLGTSVAVLKVVARAIAAELVRRADFADLWEKAKDRGQLRNGSIFLALGVELGETGEPSAVTMQLQRGSGLTTPAFYMEGDSLTVINLSGTFSMVRIP